MGLRLRVLLVEDSPEDAEIVLRELRAGGFDPVWERVEAEPTLRAALAHGHWDIVICDHKMPRLTSVDALAAVRESGLDLPFIIVSGSIDEEKAVAAMRAGADDYLMKDRLARLVPAVHRELLDAAGRRARNQAELERLRAERTIVHMASHDARTGLLNRAGLHETLQRETEAARSVLRPVSLLVVAIDRFERIQDLFGPDLSDHLLTEAARRIGGLVGDHGTVGRTGEAEFAIVIRALDAELGLDWARRVIEALEAPFALSDVPVELRPNVGVAVFPGHGDCADRLFRAAGVAARHARTEDSGIALFRPEQDPHDPRSLALLPELRKAIETDQLFLEYQPGIDLKTRRVTNVEALVRWRHPDRGAIHPDEFVRLAEGSSLIHELTRWVLKEACRQGHAWRRDGLELSVAVNLSAKDLHHPKLAERIRAAVQTWGLAPRNLELEITESALMADPQRAAAFVERLSAEGMRFAIDDFGTGFSSFGYLQKLPVHKLKIDRSFVKNLAASRRDAALVRGLVELGHNLGLQVVAEGVEDEAALEAVSAMGCDLVQGYHLGRPMSVTALAEWRAESRWCCLAAGQSA